MTVNKRSENIKNGSRRKLFAELQQENSNIYKLKKKKFDINTV